MTGVLGIVYRAISTHLAHKAGFAKPMSQTGAVTLIQRFGSALNLNIHFHMLFLDGVYIGGSSGHPMRFRHVKAPNRNELTRLTHTIAHRRARYLERQGLLERDTGKIYLSPEAVEKVREGETGNPSRSQPGLPGTGREAGLGYAADRPVTWSVRVLLGFCSVLSTLHGVAFILRLSAMPGVCPGNFKDKLKNRRNWNEKAWKLLFDTFTHFAACRWLCACRDQ